MNDKRWIRLGVCGVAGLLAACNAVPPAASAPRVARVVPPLAPAQLLVEPVAADTMLIWRDRVITMYRETQSDGRAALAKGKYDEAIRHFEEGSLLVHQYRQYLSLGEAEALLEVAKVRIEQVRAAAAVERADAAAGLRDLVHREKQRAATAADARRRKVAELVSQARVLYDNAQFREAQDLLRQATIVDPQDENAALFLRLVNSKIAARDYEAIKHRSGVEVMRQSVDSAEHLIPYTDMMVYPENWQETTRKRAGGM